jgi:hypothetical protein
MLNSGGDFGEIIAVNERLPEMSVQAGRIDRLKRGFIEHNQTSKLEDERIVPIILWDMLPFIKAQVKVSPSETA